MSKAATDTLEKVASEFEAEVLADLQSGRDQAMQTIEAARKETAEAVAKTLEAGTKQAESVRRQVIGAAELDVRNAQLRSLEVAVSDVFESAAKRVSSLPEEAYEKALATLIKEGMGIIGDKAKVHASGDQKKAVSNVVRGLNRGTAKLTLDEKGIETIGGVMLSAADGTIRFDNTFEARLERMRPSLRKDVAGILTGA